MSDNYAMYGLLSGLGEGLANMGQNMKKKSLADAEALRQENLAKIKRQQDLQDAEQLHTWQTERDDKNYGREKDLADENYSRTQAENDRNYNRQTEREDKRDARQDAKERDREARAEGSFGREMDKKLASIEAGVKSGALSPEEGAIAKKQLFGIGKKGLTEMDANEMETQTQNLTEQLMQSNSDLSFQDARLQAEGMIKGGGRRSAIVPGGGPGKGMTDNEKFSVLYDKFATLPENQQAAELQNLRENGHSALATRLERKYRDNQSKMNDSLDQVRIRQAAIDNYDY